MSATDLIVGFVAGISAGVLDSLLVTLVLRDRR